MTSVTPCKTKLMSTWQSKKKQKKIPGISYTENRFIQGLLEDQLHGFGQLCLVVDYQVLEREMKKNDQETFQQSKRIQRGMWFITGFVKN